MGIRFLCPAGHKLHVKSFLAGKRGICPHCGAKVLIPLESDLQQRQPLQTESDDAGDSPLEAQGATEFAEVESLLSTTSVVAAPGTSSPATLPQVLAEKPAATWYVRASSGEQYGPADPARMQRWLEESRIDRDMYVWRDDWPDWRTAVDVFSAEYLGEPSPARERAEPAVVPGGGMLVATEPSPVRSRLRNRRSQTLWLLALLTAAVLALIPVVVIVLMNQ